MVFITSKLTIKRNKILRHQPTILYCCMYIVVYESLYIHLPNGCVAIAIFGYAAHLLRVVIGESMVEQFKEQLCVRHRKYIHICLPKTGVSRLFNQNQIFGMVSRARKINSILGAFWGLGRLTGPQNTLCTHPEHSLDCAAHASKIRKARSS